MKATEDFGIAPTTTRRLRECFESARGLERVWIFGSRARGDARDESDIDLAADAAGWAFADYAALSARIESLNLLYRVDCVWLQHVEDAEFRRAIERDKRLFWAP